MFCFSIRVLECSAKNDVNIQETFRAFLKLTRLTQTQKEIDEMNLKRQTSGYNQREFGRNRRRAVSPGPPAKSSNKNSPEEEEKSKPRSRSLVRRNTRKTKQQIIDAQTDNCCIS